MTRSGTASAEEIARFTALADAWWDPVGEFRPLHRLNPVRIGYVKSRLVRHFGLDRQTPRPFAGRRFLDVGCGGGLLSEPMARLGAAVTAIDAGAENIRVAEVHAARQGLEIDYRCARPEELAQEGRTFDVVLAMEVVEHVADLDAFLNACSRLVDPGGAMVLATLNRTLKSLVLAKIAAEYVLRWLPVGTHDWRKFVPPSDLTAGLRRHSVDVVDLNGVAYNPLTDRWSPTADLDVNYMAFAIKR
ncbi:MAG: bifunctional 2-polyprenyl-6-hydroxyphenol methylase/3-demethylubiquinol 3-O-methyltransferase UbiG [Rhodospirillales bacterium]